MIQSLHFLVDLLQVDLSQVVKGERSEVAQRPSERRSLEVDLFRLNGLNHIQLLEIRESQDLV